MDLGKALAAYAESLHPIIYLHHFDFYELDLTQINPEAKFIGFDATCGFTGIWEKESNIEATRRASHSAHAFNFLQPPHYLHHISSLPEFLAAVFNEGFAQPTFLVLKHVHHVLHDPAVIAHLSRIAEYTLHNQEFSMTVIIESAVLDLPRELEHFTTVLELPKPDIPEIYGIIKEFASLQQLAVLPSVMTTLAWSLKGLDTCQIQQALSLAFHEGGGLDEKDKFIIQQEKLKLITGSNLLEIVESFVDSGARFNTYNLIFDNNQENGQVSGEKRLNTYNIPWGQDRWGDDRAQAYHREYNEVVEDKAEQEYYLNCNNCNDLLEGKSIQGDESGYNSVARNKKNRVQLVGLYKLKSCLNNKASVFKNLDAALTFGVELPRGLLLTGIQGCGKTTMLETAARWFEVPVLRLKSDMLWEQNSAYAVQRLKQALDLAETVGPCVLLIDGLEQVFAAGYAYCSDHKTYFSCTAHTAHNAPVVCGSPSVVDYSRSACPVYSNNVPEAYSNNSHSVYGNNAHPAYSNNAQVAYVDSALPVCGNKSHPAYCNCNRDCNCNCNCKVTNTPAYNSSLPTYSNLSTSLLSLFMHWMQHKNHSVFVAAAVNDISLLPPKILHQGCFDELFFIDLPDEATRYEIFKLHLEKHRQWSADLELHSLVEQSIGCSGADIEWVVRSAIEKAFVAQQLEVTTQNLLDSLHELKPTAVLFKDEIQLMRQCVQKFHLRPAN